MSYIPSTPKTMLDAQRAYALEHKPVEGVPTLCVSSLSYRLRVVLRSLERELRPYVQALRC